MAKHKIRVKVEKYTPPKKERKSKSVKKITQPKRIKSIGRAKTTRLFRRIIVTFVILTIILLAFVFYFAYSKTIITVFPQPKEVTVEETFSVQEATEEKNQNIISGQISQTTREETTNFKDRGTVTTVEDKARGKITVINNWTKDQPLMATTRFLSPEGILFRTTGRVDVPAGGEVEAEVVADQPGESGNIGPSKFTIPGLWLGLQDKIYGESSEPMTGGIKNVMTVNEEEIEKAEQEARENLYQKTVNVLEKESTLAEGEDKTYLQEIISQDCTASPDDQVESFEVTSKIKVIGVIYNKNELLQKLITKLNESILEDEELTRYDGQNLKFSLESYDLENQKANVTASITGSVIPKSTSSIFNKENLVNKNEAEIKSYFENFDEIESVQVKFSPFWLKRTPIFEGNIEIRIDSE